VAFNTSLAKVCVLCDGLSGDRDPDTGAGERWILVPVKDARYRRGVCEYFVSQHGDRMYVLHG
jgi:hypothetical protein